MKHTFSPVAICALCFTLVLVGSLYAADSIPTPDDHLAWYRWQVYKGTEPGLYHMPISPATPDSGIMSGYVVAYGHPLRPPYNVEARDSMVFVNGIQLIPGLRAPGVLAKERSRLDSLTGPQRIVLAARDSQYAIVDRAYGLFGSLEPLIGGRRATDSVVSWLRTCPSVDSARSGEAFVHIYFAGRVHPYNVRLARLATPAGSAAHPLLPSRTWEELTHDDRDRIVSALHLGRVVVFSEGRSWDIIGSDKLQMVGRILASSSWGRWSKYQTIDSVVGQPAWYLDNYEPSEWLLVK